MTIGGLILLVIAGVGAGLIGSLFGLGGGILMVPVLSLVFKVPMHHAIATSLLCVIATSSAAASRNIRTGVANIRLGASLEIWTVLGAILGSSLAGMLPGRTLMIIFGATIGLMSLPMMRGVPDDVRESDLAQTDAAADTFTARLDGRYFDHATETEVSYRVRRLPMAMGVASVAGVLSGLLGVGGGMLKVPVMSLWCDVPMKAAAATSNFMIGVTAAASAIIYYGRGDIEPLIGAASVIGVFAGSRTGAHVASHIHGHHLRKAFALYLLLVSIQMLWKGLS